MEKEIQKRITDFFWYPKKMKMIAYDTLQNDTDYGGLNMPNLQVINRAILTERIPKILKRNTPWTGQFIYRLGLRLREIDMEFISPNYEHTYKCTQVGEVIKDTYRKLKNQVIDWSLESFSSLKLKLHKNNEYRKEINRNYDNTWELIKHSTSNRKQRDLNYLIAHNSLPVADILVRRGLRINEKCRLCCIFNETREHLFLKCNKIQITLKYLERVIGRTISEEEIIYHEGRHKMRKKDNYLLSSFKHAIWIVRGLLYYGEIKPSEIENSVLNIFKVKSK